MSALTRVIPSAPLLAPPQEVRALPLEPQLLQPEVSDPCPPVQGLKTEIGDMVETEGALGAFSTAARDTCSHRIKQFPSTPSCSLPHPRLSASPWGSLGQRTSGP